MAIVKNNIIMEGLSGSLGKQLVIKKYKYGTVVSVYPDMSKVIASPNQKLKRSKFKDAVAFAKSIMADPSKLEPYQTQVKEGKTLYHTLLSIYLKEN